MTIWNTNERVLDGTSNEVCRRISVIRYEGDGTADVEACLLNNNGLISMDLV